LLKRRAEGYEFHVPFGDGTAIAAASSWCALLILVRLFDRSLGQNLLALACAALVFGAGMRERAKRPMDDLPADAERTRPDLAETEWVTASGAPTERVRSDDAPTERVRSDDAPTERVRSDDAPTERVSEARDPAPPPDRGASSESPPP
jgi:hypothetical protein